MKSLLFCTDFYLKSIWAKDLIFTAFDCWQEGINMSEKVCHVVQICIKSSKISISTVVFMCQVVFKTKHLNYVQLKKSSECHIPFCFWTNEHIVSPCVLCCWYWGITIHLAVDISHIFPVLREYCPMNGKRSKMWHLKWWKS